MNSDLTKRQADCLEAIRAYFAKHGAPPTVRELTTALQLRSTHSVHCHLLELERKGHISTRNGKARNIRLAGHSLELELARFIESGVVLRGALAVRIQSRLKEALRIVEKGTASEDSTPQQEPDCALPGEPVCAG